MIITHEGASPRIDPSSRVAPTALLCGDVTVGPNCSIGFGTVIVAESGPVVIGANAVIMDTAVLRGVRGAPLTLGDNVLVGPRACLTGCTIGDEVFVATGATVFNLARIGARAELRINAVVHLRTAVPADAVVPIGWIAVGDPARILPPDRHDDIWSVQRPLDFPGTVFGMSRPREGESLMPALMPRYARRLVERHHDDRLAGAIAESGCSER